MVGSVTDGTEQAAASTASGVGTATAGVQFQPQGAPDDGTTTPAVQIRNVSLWYGAHQALGNVSLDIPRNRVTALIGPSGCGKSTLLRCINRMNELIAGVRIDGEVHIDGENVYGPDVDPVDVRRVVGMVFQRPNPFPKSIYDNVAFGARINGFKGDMDGLVEESLRRAALWDEVKDGLKKSGLALSGGQQQRLCIRARDRGEPGDRADGRAVLRAGPDRDAAHRGPDAGPCERLHDRGGDA